MKLKILLFSATFCSLLSANTNALAGFEPAYYIERNQLNAEQRLQEAFDHGYQQALGQSAINTSRFDRSGVDITTLIEYQANKRHRSGNIVQQAPLAYVLRQETVDVPPLQDTGPALHALLFLVFGASVGFCRYRRKLLV